MEGDLFSELERVRAALERHGLVAVRVAWEDTARAKGSCVGPNISDVTLTARYPASAKPCREIRARRVHYDIDDRYLRDNDVCRRYTVARADTLVDMPMLRAPNFHDVSSDVPIGAFRALPAGGAAPLTLLELLRDPARIDPALRVDGALADAARDAHVLVQTQACFLRPRAGAGVEFAPTLFNYQSRDDAAAVLVLVVSAMGVSAFLPGRGAARLMHNAAGAETWLRADALARAAADGLTADERRESSLLVVQVPLAAPAAPGYREECAMARSVARGVAPAKISAGSATGAAHGGMARAGRQTVRRDFRYPIRVTVQHYYVCAAAPTEAEVAAVAARMRDVDAAAAAQGSLVAGATARATDAANRNWGGGGLTAF